MDGGAANNTPISHAVALGADKLWVRATGHACAPEALPKNALGMARHGLLLINNQRLALDVQRFESQVDVRLVPPLCPLSVSPADSPKPARSSSAHAPRPSSGSPARPAVIGAGGASVTAASLRHHWEHAAGLNLR